MRCMPIMDRHLTSSSHFGRQRLLLRLPEHPTIAGYFWVAYFTVLAYLLLG
jgi:hypothetical protein